MLTIIDIIDVAQSGSSAILSSQVLVILITVVFATAALLLTQFPPSLIKKKFDQYRMARQILRGDDHRNLNTIDLVARVIKHHHNMEIKKGDTWTSVNHEIAGAVLGSDDEAYIRKYWTFAPGLTYEQYPDGIHVKVTGDDIPCLMMSSLSYWGFHVNQEVMEYAFQKTRETGTGNHGSYLLLGKNTVVEESYQKMCKFFHRKYCCYSASGFLACMNLVSALAVKGGIIFMDEKCHVCLRFGSKLSGSTLIKFPHQNYDELRKLMVQHRHKHTGRALLVVDSIYSADGTIANVPRARQLCDEFGVLLIMDEAHSLGSLGATGHGVEEYFGMVGACDYICGVFSKTLSSYGGYVVSDYPDVEQLTVTPGVGFATGPHSFSAACVSKALDIIERDGLRVRAEMEELRQFYVEELKTHAKAVNIIHCGHNVFVSYPHAFVATAVAVEMRKRGFLISSFMFPSVPIDRSILRLTIHPLSTRENLTRFCVTLGEVNEQLSDRFGREVMFGRHKKEYYDEIATASS